MTATQFAQAGANGAADKRTEVAERRRQIPHLLASGVRPFEIAERFGVHPAQITRDVALIERWYQRDAVIDYEPVMRSELAKLDALEQKFWPKDATDLAALDRIMRIMERRARMLGLDAPTQTHVDVQGDAAVARSQALDMVMTDLQRRRELREQARLVEAIDVESTG